MPLTRRSAVQFGLAAPVAMLVGGVTTPAWAGSRSAYDRATWTPYAGATFTMSSAGASRTVVLASVDDLAGSGSGAAGCFSLVFQAAAPAPAGVVTLRRKGFADTTLFVSAVDRGVSAHHYQAIVNRPS